MLKAPIPSNEEERLAELRALRILDTPPEERFDRWVQLAAHLFGVPIAYIAMVDSDRQWFKAKCGLTTEHTDQIISMVWRKAILNACMNPVCAVTGLTMAQAMNDPIIFQIVDALIKECVKVARANEIELGWDFYPHAIEYMGKAGDHKPSMLMDIELHRRTEVDFINGKFVDYGQQAGIETSYNNTLRALVKGLESKF